MAKKGIGFFYTLTLKDAFEEFLVAKTAAGCAPGTIDAYKGHFYRSISKFLDIDMDVADLTSEILARMVVLMTRTDLSRNSIRSYTATMASFCHWMRSQGICDAKIALFKGIETVPSTYSMDDLKKLLERPKTKCFAEYRNWVIVNLLVNNGLRAASIRSLEVQDVDLENNMIRLRHTKSGRAQVVPISPALADILKGYMKRLRGKPGDALFPSNNGGKMSENCLHNAIRRYNMQRGVELTSIHAFRHTFARIYLVDCQGNALKLQRLLGHQTLDMTKKYVKIFDQDLVHDFQDKSPLSAIKKTPRRPARS